MSACFLSDLDVSLLSTTPKRWRIDSPLVFFSEIIGGKITVPVGFNTDFATVPRVPIIYLLYAHRGMKAAAVHDYLYFYKLYDRSTCDAVFREALAADGEGCFVSWAMWSGVRLLGWHYYTREATNGKDAK